MTSSTLNLDRSRVLTEIKARLERVEQSDNPRQSLIIGVNNAALHKDGKVEDGCPMLRIFDEEEWKHELVIYASSQLSVKALEIYKGEITSVLFFEELGTDRKFEVRYYSLNWADPILATDPLPTPDPRVGSLPKLFSGFELTEPCIYVFVEIKPLVTEDWEQCCVCGISRRITIPCKWSPESAPLYFCSEACESVAWCQRQHDFPEQVAAEESDEMRRLKAYLEDLNVS